MTGWRWILPSFADLFFLVFLVLLAFTPSSAGLLGDADTGWHIRTGELILATHRVPQTDPFSYTMQGKPWYAWEWLWDVAIACVHHVAGLNGVVFVTAAVISLTFALLFHLVQRRSHDLGVAAALTLLAAAAAQVHMLARPHVFSWLLALLWLECLMRFEEGDHAALLWLPLLMLVWVNLHGGWVLGLGLMAAFAVEPAWNKDRRALTWLAAILPACLAATLITPYGYRLPMHVYQYLSDGFLMNSIDEFQSPNFHHPVYLYFAAFIPLGLAAVLLAGERITLTHSLLWLCSLYGGLYAARNIPIAVLLMATVLGPLLASGLGQVRPWGVVREISDSMALLHRQLRGHTFAIAATLACGLLLLHHGRLFSRLLMQAHFDPEKYPVRAASFLAQSGIHDHLFTSDSWGAYLIYSLYPAVKVYFDDRHDFFGPSFVKEYGVAASAMRSWQQPLAHYQVRWVLMPVEAPLSSLLRSDPDWRPVYDDGVAILFAGKSK